MQEGGKQSLPRGLGNWGKHLEMARERESVELGAKLCGTQPVLSGRWGEGPGPGVPRKVPETRGFLNGMISKEKCSERQGAGGIGHPFFIFCILCCCFDTLRGTCSGTMSLSWLATSKSL